MQYDGEYDLRALPFLHTVLRATYEAREFHGGRGSPNYGSALFQYSNQIARNDFTNFEGREFILHTEYGRLGFHRYRGMCLV